MFYQTQYTDPTTEDINMQSRWYSPGTATFRSRDTYAGDLNTPVSLNRYTYAHNNPIRYSDPSGRCVELWVPECDVRSGEQRRVSDDAFDQFVEAYDTVPIAGPGSTPIGQVYRWDNAVATASDELVAKGPALGPWRQPLRPRGAPFGPVYVKPADPPLWDVVRAGFATPVDFILDEMNTKAAAAPSTSSLEQSVGSPVASFFRDFAWDFDNGKNKYPTGAPWDHKPVIAGVWDTDSDRRIEIDVAGAPWSIPVDMLSNIHYGYINEETAGTVPTFYWKYCTTQHTLTVHRISGGLRVASSCQLGLPA